MTTTKPLKLTFHKARGKLRKTIGRYVKADGTTAPSDFWLGDNQVKALHLARTLSDYWRENLEANGLVWTRQDEYRAMVLAKVTTQTMQSTVNNAAAEVARVIQLGIPVDVPQVLTPPSLVRRCGVERRKWRRQRETTTTRNGPAANVKSEIAQLEKRLKQLESEMKAVARRRKQLLRGK